LLFTLIGESDLLDQKQIKEVIESTLKDIDLYSDDAVSLIYNTGLVESKYTYLQQIKGPAKGLFQCEGWVAVDICKNYLKYRESLMKKVASACKLEWFYFLEPNEADWEKILTTNIAAQIIMCRLHYRRVPKPLPKTVEEQASQWKVYYNTAKGKGTVEKFLEIVDKYG
tara:strand:- start:507 stop:1013 length:507 start_codon:yes stop_codon:yes gene_type:complete